MRRRRVLPAAAVLALILGAVGGLSTAAGAIGRDFDHPASHDTSQQFAVANVQREDTPNDPNYDQSEPDSLNGTSSTDLYSERFDLFGFPSQLTRMTALYADGLHMGQAQISGFNAAGAWKQTRGDGDTVVAILDTGVQWASQGLRDQVHLNTGELPLPEDATGATHPDAALGGYDLNGNGRVDVDDYAHDPRVLAVKPAGESLITAHDLIVAFSDGIDEDHNGFVDDIAGWNFFDNNNDPTDLSSYFSAHNHGSGRASDAVESGNDRQGSLGVCPSCEFMPIRTWDTFVSDGNTFGMGILYATDNGASVIEGANGSLYHSAFAEAASNYAYDHGVVQTFSGNDLNTPDHNYPAAYGHTMLIEGTVPDTIGLGQEYPAQVRSLLETLGVPLGSQVPVGTYFRGANTTQFGGKSSISMEGTTGSQNTGKAAGAAALVIAAAHEVGIKLRPDETRELLEQTAESVSQADTLGTGAPDFSQTGWSPHFGWGRVNLGAAVAAAINQDTIPPEAAIDSPDWYAPLTGSSVQLGGMARSRFTGQFHYVVEWGVGQAPTSWTTVRSGDASGTVTDLGSINLADVRSALANFTPPADPGSPTFSPTSPNPLSDEFTVRLTVTAGSKRLPGVDRRVFTTFTDPTLAAGFPKRLGTGGESDIRFADLNGDGVQELVVPTEDGTVHAYEPDGSELAGWPVHTSLEWQATGHADAPGFAALADVPPLEAPRGPTIADLDGDGTMETVVAAGVHIYVFEPDGSLRPGFPVASDFNFCGPARESQQLHHPKCGFLAS
ncbi:MAG TPA: S8 family serine peptidase, partial [Mycobacteriales bacterium]|nr:S8 family serine peptidase [Mycobacteriales bacterium]